VNAFLARLTAITGAPAAPPAPAPARWVPVATAPTGLRGHAADMEDDHQAAIDGSPAAYQVSYRREDRPGSQVTVWVYLRLTGTGTCGLGLRFRYATTGPASWSYTGYLAGFGQAAWWSVYEADIVARDLAATITGIQPGNTATAAYFQYAFISEPHLFTGIFGWDGRPGHPAWLGG
jgi:hypothetical protein